MKKEKTGVSFLFAEFNKLSQDERNNIERKALDLIKEYELLINSYFWENYDGTIALTITTQQQMESLDRIWLFFTKDFTSV